MQAANVARHRSTPAATIAELNASNRSLELVWGDGHRSLFPLIWLRDYCSCDDCGDHSGGHRFFEIKDVPDDLSHEVAINDGLLEFTWQADGHRTRYDPAWLRAHCLSREERARRRHQPLTWDASIAGRVPEADYVQAQNDDQERLKIFDAVRTYGLCLLRNVPARREATEEVAGLLGYVRETHYGRVFEIISTPNPVVLANSPHPLRPHTDENFREPPPGIMIFHSIQASEDGGGVSVMTDGFKLAEDFKAQNPAGYKLLTEVPIPHRRFVEGVGLRAEAPVINLEYFGNVSQFRLNERTMGPLDLPVELIEPVYDALKSLLELTYDGQYHMHHLLQGGEALVFDNARVMHARTGFNGHRHVRLTHIGSDEFYSRWRQLRNDLKGDINLV